MFRPEQFIRYPQREAARLSLLFMAGILGVASCAEGKAMNCQTTLSKLTVSIAPATRKTEDGPTPATNESGAPDLPETPPPT